jgi:ribonuclease PH
LRTDGRNYNELRRVKITPSYLKFAEGSVLFEIGNTKVLCAASVEEKVPPFLQGTGQGWVTAEYSLLPRSTPTRIIREINRGRINGRTSEIQRLIGRSLRAVVDLNSLGERTIWLDCDVIQADGGTRVAAITGAFIALAQALKYLQDQHKIIDIPLLEYVAGISVGIVNREKYLDLNFEEDSQAEVDMNVVMTNSERIVEIQGTAEKTPFTKESLDELINLAKSGIKKLIEKQKETLSELKINF